MIVYYGFVLFEFVYGGLCGLTKLESWNSLLSSNESGATTFYA